MTSKQSTIDPKMTIFLRNDSPKTASTQSHTHYSLPFPQEGQIQYQTSQRNSTKQSLRLFKGLIPLRMLLSQEKY